MDNASFKEKIFEPLQECWRILKPIQHSKRSGPNKEWEEWEKLTSEFEKTHDDEIGHIFSQMLYSLGDEIGKINERTH
jgi:hypothetical protein